jgi:hypothetical protein
MRLTSTADAGARMVEAVRTDAGVFGLAPGPAREPLRSGCEVQAARPMLDSSAWRLEGRWSRRRDRLRA